MTKDEALRLALEALEGSIALTMAKIALRNKAIAKLEEALAQPAQGQVAWMDVCEKGQMSGLRYWSEPDNRNEIALYTTQQQRPWVGLTGQKKAWIASVSLDVHDAVHRAEAALKEKNT